MNAGIYFQIPISSSIAMMSFVGNDMGKANIRLAKIYITMGVSIFTITCLISSLLVWNLQEQLATFYTSNQDQNKLAQKAQQVFLDTLPWMIGCVLFVDSLKGNLSGALQGINKINLVFYSTIISMYVICLPIVSILAYSWGFNQGVVGIWQGFGLANLILCILDLTILFTVGFDQESQAIIARVQIQNGIELKCFFKQKLKQCDLVYLYLSVQYFIAVYNQINVFLLVILLHYQRKLIKQNLKILNPSLISITHDIKYLLLQQIMKNIIQQMLAYCVSFKPLYSDFFNFCNLVSLQVNRDCFLTQNQFVNLSPFVQEFNLIKQKLELQFLNFRTTQNSHSFFR